MRIIRAWRAPLATIVNWSLTMTFSQYDDPLGDWYGRNE
jgi:hypothetical protein